MQTAGVKTKVIQLQRATRNEIESKQLSHCKPRGNQHITRLGVMQPHSVHLSKDTPCVNVEHQFQTECYKR